MPARLCKVTRPRTWEDKLHTKRLVGVVPIALTVVIAGCGSSSSSSSSSNGSSAAASAPASPGGAYGQPPASSTSSAAAGAQSAALITAKHSKLGTILAFGAAKMTVYLFEADKGSASSCAGECAKAWPPVTGTPKASGDAKSTDLGTIKRADGTTQVTYKGHPLYRFIKDKDSGDAYGQGSKAFGASWYVLRPSGTKIDAS